MTTQLPSESCTGLHKSERVELPVYDSDFWANPFDLYDRLRKEHGTIVPIRLPNGVEPWLVIGYDDARTLLVDARLSKNSRFAAKNWHQHHPTHTEGRSKPVFDHLLTMDSPDHTRLRAIVQKDFTRKRIDAMRPRVQELADDLVRNMAQHSSVDLIASFANPLPLRFICEVLGVPLSDEPLFQEWSRILVTPELEEQDKIVAVADEMRAYLEELSIAAYNNNSLFSALALRQREGELSMEELVSMGFLLLVAGHETTVNLIANGALTAMRTPKLWKNLTAESGAAAQLTEEILRLESPLHWATPRFAREDITIDGKTIKAGDTVFVGIAAANRDSKQFSIPECVNTRRPNLQRHLAFGLGSHFCLGAVLARTEGEIAFQTLSRAFPRMQPLGSFDDLTWRPGPIMRGLAELPVLLEDPK